MNRGIFRLLSQYKSVPSELYECYQEYSDGLEQINLNSPITAEAKFKECIEILKLKNALGGPGHNFILKRLALVQRTKKAYKDCEESLETIVENCESTESPDLVPAAIDLMKQCLNTNLAKAREYGEVLQTMDLNELKNEFQFLFGVITK